MLKKFWYWIQDIILYKVLNTKYVELAYNKRIEIVRNIICDLFPIDEPYVFQGRWSWCKDSEGNPQEITLVLLDKKLFIHVLRPEVGDWYQVRNLCKNRKEWERINADYALMEGVMDALKEEVAFISIPWGYPVNKFSLRELVGNYRTTK